MQLQEYQQKQAQLRQLTIEVNDLREAAYDDLYEMIDYLVVEMDKETLVTALTVLVGRELGLADAADAKQIIQRLGLD